MFGPCQQIILTSLKKNIFLHFHFVPLNLKIVIGFKVQQLSNERWKGENPRVHWVRPLVGKIIKSPQTQQNRRYVTL